MTSAGQPSFGESSSRLRVCHVAMGDLWAGAEVQLTLLISKLALRPDLNLSIVLFNHGKLEKELVKFGIPVEVFPESEWGSRRIFSELVRTFKRSRIQLVHTHKHKDTVLAALAAKKSGVSHVVRTVHGLREPFAGWPAIKMSLYEAVEGVVRRCCVEALIGVSSHIENVCKTQAAVRRVVCIRNGIELAGVPTRTDRWVVRNGLGVDSKTCLIGTLGRLTSVKGLPYLMKAAGILLQHGVKVKVLVVGDGPLRQELERQTLDLGIGESVVFLGHREDTHELMQAIDIFALPSLSEGIPMALLEAMGASRAIIASRVGGVPEVLENGAEGILVEPKDVDGIVEGCLRLIRDPTAAERMGQLARRRVERDFSAESMADKVASLYLQLAAPPPQPGYVS